MASRPSRYPLNQTQNRPVTGVNVTGAPRILAIVNQKGGVGKTTTAVNLATALAAVGKRVLLIDLDPQGNASTGLGIRRASVMKTVYHVLSGDVPAAAAAMETKIPGLKIIPSSVHLSGAELELVTAKRREYRLRETLRDTLPFDYILIDCPPSLGLLTLNALVASDSLVVPLQCEFYALEGLSHLTRTVERVKRVYNPNLDIHGVVLTMYDRRNNLSGMVARDVRKFFGDKVYKTVIPRNIRVSEAPSHGLPAIVYDMGCPGSQSYIHLAGEILEREKVILQSKAQKEKAA